MPTPSASNLRRSGLAAYAYATLPAEHPARAELRADYLATLVRHQEVKEEVLRLLAAWRTAGVDALLFGGFRLAELVYATPGTRLYEAADVLLRPETVAAAGGVARDLGWSDVPRHRTLALRGPAGRARVDAWRAAVGGLLPWAPARITAAVWADSSECACDDVVVRVMSPRDEVVVALVLRRRGFRLWHRRQRDVAAVLIDAHQLRRRFGLSTEDLRARARELGCRRAVEAFLAPTSRAWGGEDSMGTIVADAVSSFSGGAPR